MPRCRSVGNSARLLFCVKSKLLVVIISICVALVAAPLVNYTYNGSRPCDLTYGILQASMSITFLYPFLCAITYTGVFHQTRMTFRTLVLLVSILAMPSLVFSAAWMCDGYIFAWYFDLESQMSVLYKVSQVMQQVVGMPMTSLVFLMLYRGSCRPRGFVVSVWLVCVFTVVSSRASILWSFETLGWVLRYAGYIATFLLTLSTTCTWKCCASSQRDNSVYLFFGTFYMGLTMPMMCYLLVYAGTLVADQPAYATGAVIVGYSIAEMLISRFVL